MLKKKKKKKKKKTLIDPRLNSDMIISVEVCVIDAKEKRKRGREHVCVRVCFGFNIDFGYLTCKGWCAGYDD